MTEADWLVAKCIRDLDLLHVVAKRFRKLRLYGCACARRALAFVPDERFHAGLDAAERFADGDLNRVQVKSFRASVLSARLDLKRDHNVRREQHETTQAVFQVLKEKPLDAFAGHKSARYAFAAFATDWRTGFEVEERAQMAIAYDIFGNPFRPVAIDPSWLTSDVRTLAEGIYQDRAFDRMPILADALQDAGCDNEDILNHCRGDGPHVRGCWVVDLVLGKS
jgi:hypothetical protein